MPSLEIADFQIWSQKIDAPDSLWNYASMPNNKTAGLAHPITLDCISEWEVRFPHLAETLASPRGLTPTTVLHARVNVGLSDHLNPREWMLQTHMMCKLHNEVSGLGSWQSSFKIYSTGAHKVLDLVEDVGEYENSDGQGIALSAPFPVIFWQHFLFGLMESQDPSRDPAMGGFIDTPSQIRARKKKEKEAKAVLGGITMVQEILCRSSNTGLQQPVYQILWEFGRADSGKDSFTYRKIILPKKSSERQVGSSKGTPSIGQAYMPSPHLSAPTPYPSYPMQMSPYPQSYDGQQMMTPANQYYPVYSSSYPPPQLQQPQMHQQAGSDANASPEHPSPLPAYSNMMLPLPHGQQTAPPALHHAAPNVYGSSPYHPQSSPLIGRMHQHQLSATRGEVPFVSDLRFAQHPHIHQPAPMNNAHAMHVIAQSLSDEEDRVSCEELGDELAQSARQPGSTAQDMHIYEDME